MAYIYDLIDTWNNAGTTFTAIKMNVTDTASNASSLLMDLQVGGTSQFKVRKDGVTTVGNNIDVVYEGTTRVSIWPSLSQALAFRSDNFIAWSSTTTVPGTSDVRLYRDAAATLAQRNSTNAQTYRLYGTFTDASNYERGYLTTDSNGFTIGTEALGTGTKRPVRIIGPSLASAESVSILELSQTWNTSGTPTGLKLNVTDTASNAASLLMDLQVGGASRFQVTKAGSALFRAGAGASFYRGSDDSITGTISAVSASGSIDISGGFRFAITSGDSGTFYLSGTNRAIQFGTSDGDGSIRRRAASNIQLGPVDVGAVTATVSITIAAPGVVTWSNHNLSTGTPVVFTTTGALPTGITAGTTYYAVVVTTSTFQIASSVANAIAATPTVITTSGTQSGTHTGTRYNITQRLSMQGVTGVTDRLGADLFIQGSQGTGTGAGGSIIFQVAPAGSTGAAQNALATALTLNSDKTSSFGGDIFGPNAAFAIKTFSTNSFEVWHGNLRGFQINYSSGVKIGNYMGLGWTTGTDVNTTVDLQLFRDAAYILAQRNSTNAQTYRLYGTYTDASNYERGYMTTDSNGFTIGTEALGTGTKRPVRIIGPSLASAESVSALELSQTWNTSGTPTGLKLNVTDTASNAASLLMDLQVGGTSKFSVSKIGLVTLGNGNQLFSDATGLKITNNSGVGSFVTRSDFSFIPAASAYAWGDMATFALDLYLTRRGAASLRLGAADTSASATITVTIASPGVVTWSNHGLVTGTPVVFSTTGALPTGITAATTYYVIVVDGNTFQLATSFANALAGTAVNTSGSQSGTHTGRRGAIAQTLGVQDTLSTSSLENIDGADFVIRGSRGIGNKPGGSIIFQVAPAGSSGSAQNALADALIINADKTIVLYEGTATNPTIRFGSTTSNNGINKATNRFDFVIGAVEFGTVGVLNSITGFRVKEDGAFSFANSARSYNDYDLALFRDTSNTLAQRNANNGQTFRLYGRFTDATNDFERFFISAPTTSGAAVLLGTQKGATTGAARALEFQTDGTTRLTIASTGLVTVNGGNLVLGEIGVLRTRYINNGNNSLSMFDFVADGTGTASFALGGSAPLMRFGGTSALFPALKRSSTFLEVRLADDSNYAGFRCASMDAYSSITLRGTTEGTRRLSWNGVGVIRAQSDGVFTWQNDAQTDFGRLQFGGTTSSFPALKRSSASLQVRLADDSANAALESASIKTDAPAGGTAATWKLGTVASVSPTSPNRTIEVDIGGTIYYLHAKTTND